MIGDRAKDIKFSNSRWHKFKTDMDHAKGKPSSETLNRAKIKIKDALN